MGLEVKVDSHVDEVKTALEDAIENALEAIGIQATSHAKQYISSDPVRVDTGLLRNSITYAVAGKAPAESSYSADKGDGKGSYSGTAPSGGKNDKAVYVGTNVEYAIYVHEGTSKMSANRFLKNAVMNHKDEYKAIAEQALK